MSAAGQGAVTASNPQTVPTVCVSAVILRLRKVPCHQDGVTGVISELYIWRLGRQCLPDVPKSLRDSGKYSCPPARLRDLTSTALPDSVKIRTA